MSTRITSWKAIVALTVSVIFVGCADSAAPASESSASAPEAEAASDVFTTNAAGQTTLDMDAIFPPGEGRVILLNNCQSCHSWVPVVVLGMAEDEWARWRQEHRQRVPGISDEQFEVLYSYLVTNFNPNTPVPDLPPGMLESWTTY